MKIKELSEILSPRYDSYELCILVDGVRVSIDENNFIEDEETHAIIIDL